MLDFVSYREEEASRVKDGKKEDIIKVSPSFVIQRSDHLMVQGGIFHAVWDEDSRLWSEDIKELVRIVDKGLDEHVASMPEGHRIMAVPLYMRDEGNLKISNFIRFCKNGGDNFTPLNQKILFANDVAKPSDYASMKLTYAIEEGDIGSYKEMMELLFAPHELHKLEWSVGAIITGEAKTIQKFMVLYGVPGTGKSTFLDLVGNLFENYCAPFEAKQLAASSQQFAMSAFKGGPLVGIDHDGSLAKIEDNTTLNSIISHEQMIVNEKHKAQYAMKMNTFLFLGTNKLVKISDAQSGLIRRLVDVHITGMRHNPATYRRLIEGMKFELGAIAYHCREVFLKAGRDYYSGYIPTKMIYGTNALHNFVEYYRMDFEKMEFITLAQVYAWYRQYMEEANEKFILNRREFGEELKSYFDEFHIRDQSIEGRPRNVYVGFKKDFMVEKPIEPITIPEIKWPPLDKTESLLDDVLKDRPAQYAGESGKPVQKWDDVTTVMGDLDSTELHFVRPELNHIVIDFDMKDEEGSKSREKNLEAIQHWPETYAEFSQSGNGVHLHYFYSGDPETLSRVYAEDVEIKVFTGHSSLRRRFSAGNNIPISSLTSGLPLKEARVISDREIKSETGLRRLIEKNLMKQIHPGTKPSIDFIDKILKEAYESDLVYDLSDMKKIMVSFALNSSNQSAYCLKLVKQMKFKSKEEHTDVPYPEDSRVAYFDVEVFPNLFVVCWKYAGDANRVAMINPTPEEIGALLSLKLVGFYNRKYDNHILYARYMGYSNERLYELSQSLINNSRSPFGAAYGISYADVYDYASVKQSLKRWQVKLGIRHMELNIPWDQPVPDELIEKVVEYCHNDVEATERTAEDRHNDFVARQILSDLSGMPINATGNTHSARIIFGDDKDAQREFVYTDLSETFPGYTFDWGKSDYLGMDPSEGGFVHAKPGMYSHVKVFDVTSMHPASIIALNLFGDTYTAKFKELVDARIAIKRGDYAAASKMLDGKLAKYLLDPKDAKGLAYALKIVINSVYGLTSAKFDNPFRDKRNIDNIVAKRGALFMVKLLTELEKIGAEVVHIKTDSIKILDSNPELEKFIIDMGKEYGYDFEVESEYEKFCLVNNAVYIARKETGEWEAVGTQFKHPYVFKELFSGEPTTFDDLVEVKTVQTSLWIEREGESPWFVGKAGAFVPVLSGGGDLKRMNKEGGFGFASGTKGHKWQEAEVERQNSDGRYDNIDMSYFDTLVDNAFDQIKKFGDPNWFFDITKEK